MRIMVWNCRMALARKRELLYKLRADIAVIPECSRQSMLDCQQDGFDTCWWGDNPHKGLGVIAGKPWTLTPEAGPRQECLKQSRPQQNSPKQSCPKQKWIAPVRVHGPLEFLLLAVWACPVDTVREKNYVGQTYDAIVRHPEWFDANIPTVIGGDFNSNSCLDEGRKKRKHSSVVKMLAERGIVSAYHAFFSEDHGAETRPTYYFWHRKERCFHLDYIFLPDAWMERVTAVRVGTFRKWRPASDHVPIWVDVADGDGSQ